MPQPYPRLTELEFAGVAPRHWDLFKVPEVIPVYKPEWRTVLSSLDFYPGPGLHTQSQMDGEEVLNGLGLAPL